MSNPPEMPADATPTEAIGEPVEAQPAQSTGEILPPLGSVFTPFQLRLAAIVVILLCGGLLGIATWLSPDGRGYGTHEQLPWQGPCGFLLSTGYPCPTCGMTTAFAYTMDGDWWSAIKTQPGGWALAVGCGLAVLMSLWVLVTGRLPIWFILWVTPFRFFVTMLTLILGSWALILVIGTANGTWPNR